VEREFYGISGIFPISLESLFNSNKIQIGIASKIYISKSGKILNMDKKRE
jgi:hypothetical protein